MMTFWPLFFAFGVATFFVMILFLWAICVVLYYVDPWYRAEFGRPPFWPFRKGF